MSGLAGLGVNALGLGRDAYGSVKGVTGRVVFIDPNDPKNNTSGVTFDCALTEEYSTSASATKFPIEGGGTISDHVVVDALSLKVTGLVSDTPIHDVRALLTEGALTAGGALLNAAGIGALGTVAAGAAALALDDSRSGARAPSRKAYANLLQLWRGGDSGAGPVPFQVRTKLGDYDNMIITDLTVPRDASTGDSLTFNVTLVQLTIVSPQTVKVDVASAAVSSRKKKEGIKPASRIADATTQGITKGRAMLGGQ